jgi:DNA-binding FadR family transcriptional regulator
MMVEPPTCYYAAKRASPDEVRTIKLLSLKLKEQAERGEEALKTEQDFHNAIALASHNHFMIQLTSIISRSIYTDIMCLRESLRYSIQDYQEIVRYIENGNAEGARTIMQLHIFHAYQMSNLRFE